MFKERPEPNCKWSSPEPTDECSTDEGGEEDVAATASENDHQQADEHDDDVDPPLEAVKRHQRNRQQQLASNLMKAIMRKRLVLQDSIRRNL